MTLAARGSSSAAARAIGVEARARVCPPGDTRRTIIADLLRGLHPAVVSLGLASQPELDALDRAVRSHLDDPRDRAAHALWPQPRLRNRR
jgi:hypothetical protein